VGCLLGVISWFFWVRCLGSFVGCLLGLFRFFWLSLGLLAGFLFGFFRVSCGSPLYTSCVRRSALPFHFNKLLITYKKNKNKKTI
jgi:hypothetical protein